MCHTHHGTTGSCTLLVPTYFFFTNNVTKLQAIESGNHEGARIYAQDAIREKNQSLNHLRMASRLDACCSRIETAVRMNQVSTGMKGVVRGMDKSLASMNIEQLSKVMDKFESQFEDLDVKVSCRNIVFFFPPESTVDGTSHSLLLLLLLPTMLCGCSFLFLLVVVFVMC